MLILENLQNQNEEEQESFPVSLEPIDNSSSITITKHIKNYDFLPFHAQPYKQRELDYSKYLLNKSGKFKTILHRKWRQEAKSKASSLYVSMESNNFEKSHLYLEELSNKLLNENRKPRPSLNNYLKIWETNKQIIAGPCSYKANIIDTLLIQQKPEFKIANFTGKIKLYIDRFLMVDFASSLHQENNFYHLKATKRIKSKELHHFDHPKYSIILLVNKVP